MGGGGVTWMAYSWDGECWLKKKGPFYILEYDIVKIWKGRLSLQHMFKIFYFDKLVEVMVLHSFKLLRELS